MGVDVDSTNMSDHMEYIVHGSKNQIDSSIFTYFGASFETNATLLTTDIGHALVVVCDLTQIPAEGSGCRWGAAGIPDPWYLSQVTDNHQCVTKICSQQIETSHSFQNSLQSK